ncbi:serine protease inhibitor ecotin [Devosia faecipullorum]|uniref:serine protease inhibitor ecotin n=1 Tax=Devosia faecipullorum TaxID=2755039 RepID=UPI00187BBD1A|nr:serine protease inhibitor ecotin [Devosia faecipullorum]MBE7734485.1 serine protease inhibitor ecotin [Devosia faecipullorum]
MKTAVLALGASLLFTTTALADSQDLAPYPAASAGQVQHVIRLPSLEDETTAKVEIIVGKTMNVDCNQHFFGGQLEEKIVDGWGYNYFVLESLGSGASTLMGCVEGSEREAFVRSSSETLVRYNSKLPVVIYTPDDVDVRYRVWQAGPVKNAADE